MLPSAADLHEKCLDSLNTYHHTKFHRDHTIKLGWYYQTKSLRLRADLPLTFTYERLNEWRPKTEHSHLRKQIHAQPEINFKIKGLEIWFNIQHTPPSQALMLDVRDDSNPLAIHLGNPSLKSSYAYYFSTAWSGFQQEKMRQWNLRVHWFAIDNALGQLRRFNPQTGGYTYTPWNIDGNQGLAVKGSMSQSLGKSKHWFLNLGTDIQLNRSVDFANTSQAKDFQKSIVHNLNVAPNVGIDYRYNKWHAGLKVSADWERLTSEQENFNTLSQVDVLYTLNFKAPLPFDVDFNTQLNWFMRRGYSNHAMNTDEWVWDLNLNRHLDKRKKWLMRISIHDMLGQLSAVRRTLNAQGRVETISNTLTRNIMLHLIWKFNKEPKKK